MLCDNFFGNKFRSYRTTKNLRQEKEVEELEIIIGKLRDVIPEQRMKKIKTIALKEIQSGGMDSYSARVIEYKEKNSHNSLYKFYKEKDKLQRAIELQEAKQELSISLCKAYKEGIPSWLKNKMIEVYCKDSLTLNYARRLCELADLFSGVCDNEYVAYLLSLCGMNRRYWT